MSWNVWSSDEYIYIYILIMDQKIAETSRFYRNLRKPRVPWASKAPNISMAGRAGPPQLGHTCPRIHRCNADITSEEVMVINGD